MPYIFFCPCDGKCTIINEWSQLLIVMHCFSLRSWIGWDTTYCFAATETSRTEENLHECESRTCMYWQAEKETEAKGAWRWDTKNNKELKLTWQFCSFVFFYFYIVQCIFSKIWTGEWFRIHIQILSS